MSEKTYQTRLRLAHAGNTLNPALTVLRAKGYGLYYFPNENEEKCGDYWAIKEGREFISDDPVALLGLVALWEHLGDEWRDEIHDEIGDIYEFTFPENEYAELDDSQFQNLVNHLKPFFYVQDIELADNITRKQLAGLMNTFYKEPIYDDE